MLGVLMMKSVKESIEPDHGTTTDESLILLITRLLFKSVLPILLKSTTPTAGLSSKSHCSKTLNSVVMLQTYSLYCNKVKQISPCGPGALFDNYIGNVSWLLVLAQGVVPKRLGGSVRPTSQNPYPIYDQNLRYSLPYL